MQGTPAPAGWAWLLVMEHPDDESGPPQNHLMPNPLAKWSTRPTTQCGVRVFSDQLMRAQDAEKTCADCWEHAIGCQLATAPSTPQREGYEQRLREGHRGELADRVEQVNVEGPS